MQDYARFEPEFHARDASGDASFVIAVESPILAHFVLMSVQQSMYILYIQLSSIIPSIVRISIL